MTYHPHRPELHVSPERGILEGPAGIVVDHGNWHVFSQYEAAQRRSGKDGRWAHQYSPGNPYNWEICDDVLAGAEQDGAGRGAAGHKDAPTGYRAGSVVDHQAGAVLYSTAVFENKTEIHRHIMANLERSTLEVSDDVTAVDPTVTHCGPIQWDGPAPQRPRSPCVIPNGEGRWLMLAVTGPMERPRTVVARSEDMVRWRVDGEIQFSGHTGFAPDEALVAPRLIHLEDEVRGGEFDVLIITVEHDGVDISGYLVGTLEGAVFKVVTPFSRVDHGHDFTRPRNTNAVGGRDRSVAVIFGCMNGVGRNTDVATQPSFTEEGWANCLSLPRRVTLQDGLLYQTPVPGLAQAIEESERARGWMGLLDTRSGSVSLDILDSAGVVAARVTHRGDVVEIDRSMNELLAQTDAAIEHVAVAPLVPADTDSLTVIADGSTLEVFADGGSAALASRIYFRGVCSGFAVTTTGDAVVERCYEVAPRRL